MKTPEQIAAELTWKDAAVIVREGRAYGNCPFDARLLRPLIRKGLFTVNQMQGFRPNYELTNLGLAVRAILKEQADVK